MLFWLQTGSAITGLGAAALWFRSAAVNAPPMTYSGTEQLQDFLDRASRFNKWAAGVTAFSVLLSSAATLLSAIDRGP